MTQKDKIISLLKENKIMTQGQLSISIYGDRKCMPAIYSALMSLVNAGIVSRTGAYPSYYSLRDNERDISSNLQKQPYVKPMTQKEKIISLLKDNHTMTQGQLSIDIYGDSKHMPAIYASLMSLVNSGIITRTGSYPSHYSLVENDTDSHQNSTNEQENLNFESSNEFIEDIDDEIEKILLMDADLF